MCCTCVTVRAKAKIPSTRYAIYECRMSFLFQIYEGNVKVPMAFTFAFAPISAWSDPLAAFAFAFAFAFGHVEAPQYIYKLFQLLLHSHASCQIYGTLAHHL